MFEYYCWYCGNDVEIKTADASIVDGKIRIPVEMCQGCLNSEKSSAYNKGYEEGQSGK